MNHSLLLFGFALGLGWRVATIAFYIVYLRISLLQRKALAD